MLKAFVFHQIPYTHPPHPARKELLRHMPVAATATFRGASLMSSNSLDKLGWISRNQVNFFGQRARQQKNIGSVGPQIKDNIIWFLGLAFF